MLEVGTFRIAAYVFAGQPYAVQYFLLFWLFCIHVSGSFAQWGN